MLFHAKSWYLLKMSGLLKTFDAHQDSIASSDVKDPTIVMVSVSEFFLRRTKRESFFFFFLTCQLNTTV